MDEEDNARTTGVGPNSNVAIEGDIRFIDDIEHHMNCIKNRLRIVDVLVEERKPWWRLW